MNPDNEEFTDDRLIACANAHTRQDAAGSAWTRCSPTSTTFCAGATQSDDVTVVMVRYNGV